ncbi:MAG TPA: 2-amino-4-hydroxy-6-hydroxymethyldihydropteridine diphosphokinase [Oligoflexia bacterium]|nr:2-amino-4-hydroxy-6-hydroxymethyldihydropteridine diphosphokinase [Oligoflexia bacterium]HMP49640.1 2-amino-4-hydroxy-6-hydroxymethyldihydropteridine diphosphokinase [Oligoflexia bacterium]
MKYFIGLGGNTGNVPDTFNSVINLIGPILEGEVKRSASWYWSRPLPCDYLSNDESTSLQEKYLNTVIEVESSLDPYMAMPRLIKLEEYLGRKRIKGFRWGPRTIDIDIIACEDFITRSDTLTIPHLRLHERDFVLVPLKELEPKWKHPVLSLTVTEMIHALPPDARYILNAV